MATDNKHQLIEQFIAAAFAEDIGDGDHTSLACLPPNAQKKARLFQHIGNKPIGWFLFQRTNPACERRVIHLEDGWTRQSCYTWHGCKFIVQETFLPAFEQFIRQH